jgi:hypothetical protein
VNTAPGRAVSERRPSPTPRECFKATARFQGGALPRFEAGGFWTETIERWHREGLPAGVTPWEHFRLDQFMDNAPPELSYHTDRVITPPYWPAFEPRVIEETAEHVVRLGDDGIVTRQVKHGTSVPQFISYPVQRESDWPAVERRLDPEAPGRYADLERVAGRVRGRTTVLRFGICGAYGTLRNLFGPEGLGYALYDCPDLVRRILRHWVRFTCSLADHLCPAIDFDYAFLWEDMAFKTGPLLSPAHSRQLLLPAWREVIDYLRGRHGLDLVMVDSDGNDWELLPIFLEAGVNLFTPLEIAAGMEPLAIRDRHPSLALLGGIDKRVLRDGREAIRREIDRKVPALLARGGYFPSLDHHVPADVSFEGFSVYLEELRSVTE